MHKDRALTYSILAHIRTNSTLIKGPLDIFAPLIKRVLSKMNYDGIFSGKSISEIKAYSDTLYNIDFPLPVLEKILKQIANSVNNEDKVLFTINQDKSFIINGYVFSEFEEEIRKHQLKIRNLEKLFQNFCKSSGFEILDKSIFKFIEKNKISLGKYLSKSHHKNGNDYSIEAQFIEYFKTITPVYELIKQIYLGSILAGYIEYTPENIKVDVELLLDTNFILGLLDLNTPESRHTCSTLLKIAQSHGYVCKVMADTIDEIKSLLDAKCQHFDESFLQRIVYPEDIYNACERRGLNKADLERICDNLEIELSRNKIFVIFDTSKLKNEAKFTDEYLTLKKIRNTPKSALHDAMAILYVRKKRNKNIYDFEKANCWFVNNAISREGTNTYENTGRQMEIIKADDLLNILWLSNPQSKLDISDVELVDIGLSSLISLTLNQSLPKTSIIRELDDNIQKYAVTEISDNDIIRIATRITNKQLNDIEVINALAVSDNEEFIRRLKTEAKKQETIEQERLKMLDSVVQKLSKEGDRLDELKIELENKSKNIDIVAEDFEVKKKEKDFQIESLKMRVLREANNRRAEDLKMFYIKKIKEWRYKTWKEFIFSTILIVIVILIIFGFSDWEFETFTRNLKELKENTVIGFIVAIALFLYTSITIKTIYDKYRNHSNIENYKKGLEIPENLQELKEFPEAGKI